MKFKAAIIEKFNEGPNIREFEIEPLKKGELLVKIESAGVCGSDLHIFSGKDPRITLPMIPGHEGVGVVADLRGDRYDVRGKPLCEGDRIIWDRGIVCGKCRYCLIEKRPYLCVNRKVYGITFDINDESFPNGCYSEYIKLSEGTNVIKVSKDISPEVLVPVGCSGATSFHAVEESGLCGGGNVLIQGPGPLGIFTALFCKERGVKKIIMTGSSKSETRMELSMSFGVNHLLYRDKMTLEEQIDCVMDLTEGEGVDVVFEMAGTKSAVEDGQDFIRHGGVYVIAGISVPVGGVGIKVYENIVRKNGTIKGAWVSDTSHLVKTLEILEENRYPFERLVSKKFLLNQAREAIESVDDRDILKSVIML
jgi:threonine dehydrogenase-like Zn-dependent dehydrogenase